MVEPVLNLVPTIYRTALVGVTRNGVAYPVVCVQGRWTLPTGHLQEWLSTWPEIERALLEQAARHEHTRGIVTFLRHPGFPVDVRHNSKIFREKLAVWADRTLGKRWRPQGHPSPRVGLQEAPR